MYRCMVGSVYALGLRLNKSLADFGPRTPVMGQE